MQDIVREFSQGSYTIFQAEANLPANYENTVKLAISNAIKRACFLDIEHDLVLANEIKHAMVSDIDPDIADPRPIEFVESINAYLALNRNINQSIASNIEKKLKRCFELARKLAFDLTFDLGSQKIIFNRDDDRILDIFIDLYTLQERIAGRSPAFEGIRLVKERIK